MSPIKHIGIFPFSNLVIKKTTAFVVIRVTFSKTEIEFLVELKIARQIFSMYTERLAQVRTLCSEKRRGWGIGEGRGRNVWKKSFDYWSKLHTMNSNLSKTDCVFEEICQVPSPIHQDFEYRFDTFFDIFSPVKFWERLVTLVWLRVFWFSKNLDKHLD